LSLKAVFINTLLFKIKIKKVKCYSVFIEIEKFKHLADEYFADTVLRAKLTKAQPFAIALVPLCTDTLINYRIIVKC